MPMKGSVPQRISEFHSGPTYAHTRAKFGKKRADKQAIAAAINSKRKDDPPMAKSYESGMAGEKGMSPRKAMASGKIGGGSFGARSYDSINGGNAHPDHAANTGGKGAVGDSERGTPPGIHHTKGHLPAQAAPRHGPHHPGGYGEHFKRDGAA